MPSSAGSQVLCEIIKLCLNTRDFLYSSFSFFFLCGLGTLVPQTRTKPVPQKSKHGTPNCWILQGIPLGF